MTTRTAAPACAGRLAALAVALAASVPAAATPPITLVYETHVEIDARLILHDAKRGATEVRETLKGLAGDRLAIARVVPTSAGPLTAGVILEARPDEGTSRCALRVESEVRGPGRSPVVAERDAAVDSGRLLLTDLWSDPASGRRLVLATSVSWEQVPSITTLVPGSEPLDVVVEVLLGDKGGGEVVERHRLGGLVGSKVSYTFRQLPGSDPAAESRGALTIEVLPREISDGKADLDITISHAGESPYSKLASMNLALRERLAPGYSVSLPLPRGADGAPLTFRVTPYF